MLKLTWTFTGLPCVESMIGQPLALVHNPSGCRIGTRQSPSIVTIHDVFALKDPSLMGVRQRVSMTPQIAAKAAQHANHILTVSENSKRDICELFGTPPDKITVIPNGVDHEVFKPVEDAEQIQRVKTKHGINGPFILYLGSLYSRKIGKLPEAFKIVGDTASLSHKLVMVGGRVSHVRKEEDLASRIERLGLEDKIILTGVVPEADVPALMSAADVFVYTSLFEGFGISPLEAMACGAPVITSNTTSLPEVVGEAGLLVNPTDEQEIAAAIMRVLTDIQLQAEMRRRSLERAALFSWERFAHQTLDVYRKMAQSDG